MKSFDVYAYGVIASSELHLLSMPFPSPDSYAEIAETHFMTGGEALNSAIVLSRLGLSVQLDGNWIGDTPAGERLLATIRSYGIDTRRLTVQKNFAGVREIVFSDEHTRTIFGNYVDLLSTTRKWNIPHQADLANAHIVCVDPPFQEESARVGAYAVELGIPFVSIDCPYDQPLSTAAAAVILSGEFRNRQYPQADLNTLFAEYQQRAQGLVVFTVGQDAILYGRRGAPVRRFKPQRRPGISAIHYSFSKAHPTHLRERCPRPCQFTGKEGPSTSSARCLFQRSCIKRGLDKIQSFPPSMNRITSAWVGLFSTPGKVAHTSPATAAA